MPVLNPIVNVILKSLSMDIQNINLISWKVAEKSMTTNYSTDRMERKKR